MPGFADDLIHSLKIHPFCDAADVKGLSREQRAALHAFLNEMLASYHRACEKVPEEAVKYIVELRLRQILAPKRD